MSPDHSHFATTGGKPRNHWWFGRVFHMQWRGLGWKMSVLSFGGFPSAKLIPITRSSLKSAAPNGGGQRSKPLKS